jgi:hypothetical protein
MAGSIAAFIITISVEEKKCNTSMIVSRDMASWLNYGHLAL